MDNSPEYTDTITRILTLLRTTFGENFKSYYEGDPIQIPKSSFPCIIVEKVATQIAVGATGTDRLTEQLSVRVVLNKSDDYGASDNFDTTERKLRRLVEARDASTGLFQADTLMHVLRTNITLGSVVLDSTIEVLYELNPRPEQLVTSEASLSIVTTQDVFVNNRV